jgi:L-fuculose-phosphate aldolase
MTREAELRQEIIEAGRRLYEKDFVASNDGNISVRLSETELLATPTGVSKGFMTPDQILKVDYQGNLITGFMKPTSELKMHLAVYTCRADVQAVVHAHPPTATGFAVAGEPMDKIAMPEVVYNLGQIRLSKYATPTTEEVPASIAEHITCSDAVLLANHGAITVGDNVMDAYFKMETLEAVAKITLVARTLGNENILDDDQKQVLYRIRENMGKKVYTETDCGACNLPQPAAPQKEQKPIESSTTGEKIHLGEDEIRTIVSTILEFVS